ncbi:alpha/beta-hydrolase [Rhizodiscina lignyota]|uniref:Alpha/beta-hydrolase n=1 Tax=Rhizodiscina lignyota TaxID=1504668 RepID=A0A9P4II99_9PEZI|nr:alpha/beta-hydrolase [Rhizodiscina lignyota]
MADTTGETTSFQHASIGTIRGIVRSPSVSQFLGIQYATLKNRFARAQLIESYENYADNDKALDATKYGPLPLCHPQACYMEQLLIQHALPHPEYRQSDIDCLTVNIVTPSEDQVPPNQALPVLVFVHGGGFVTGSTSWPQSDLSELVNLSVKNGMPIVAVGVNYRLGAPGFLTSQAMREAGYEANNGLHDQRLALHWVQRYIGGFGGDPERVTFLGESAGGTSGFFHLQSNESLFHQLISMAGTSIIMRPIPDPVAEMAYQMVTKALGLEDLSSEHQVEALLKAPPEDLVMKIPPGTPIIPILDDEMLRGMTTYNILSDPESTAKLFPAMDACKRILVGDSQFDASVFMVTALAHRSDRFSRTIEKCLYTALGSDNSSTVQALLLAYGIDVSNTSNDPEAIKPVLEFGHDICFYHAAKAFAKVWSASSDSKAFLYHFNAPNPWDGVWKGHAGHVLDIAFLFQNYNVYLSPGQLACAQRVANDFITFINGHEPWKEYEEKANAGAMVYNAAPGSQEDESGYVREEEGARIARRDILQSFENDPGLDKLMDAWTIFLSGAVQ